ncbi:hypothetical protein CEY16_00130 [Halalkalibacillus sediminis]|uniref:HTH gntR-type domain-containing protein n=1 Tax=Halalkalibacillus sediminis TaxID=2018042 RepID=A0A2I0QV75_9BACI|nr:GntR family transcriptional regulator [Halalkalibacillus sediminis]PKR78204.1 hypothetical protein CEY16_00130 [Halalkalibacillus sediminis]
MIKKPLNEVIFDDLYEKIKISYFAVGDSLPTEYEMQEIYGVSRAPIRQALSKLKSEGFITRKPGIGTVVAENSVSAPWTPMGGFSSQFKASSDSLSCQTLDVSTVIPDEHITESFQIEKDYPVSKITRIRKEDRQPIFLLNHYYLDVDLEKIRQAGDILYMRQFASEVLGINFEYVKEDLKAVNADKNIASLLEVEEGAPLLKIMRLSYDADYNPVEYVEYFVNSDKWPYSIVFSKSGQNFEY